MSSQDGKGYRGFLLHPITLALLGLCLIAITLFLSQNQKSRDLSQIGANTVSLARSHAREIEARYATIVEAITRLTATGSPLDGAASKAWNEDATFYVHSFPGIARIVWVDQAFRIRRIVPIQGNESYLDQSANSLETDPSDMSLWLPISEDGTFAGFIVALTSIKQFMSPVIEELNDDYMLRITEEGASVFESENWNSSQETSIVRELVTLRRTGVLNLAIAPTASLVHSETAAARWTLALGLLLSIVVMLVVFLARSSRALAVLSELRYRELFTASRDAIFVMGRGGTFQDANRAAAVLLGYSLTELRQMTLGDLTSHDDSQSPSMRSDVLREDGGTDEFMLCGKDGQTIPVELMSSPIGGKKTDGHILGIARDITDRKRIESERLLTEAHLQQSQKLESIGTLASGVAHEINNPLMGMIGYAELICGGIDYPKAQEYSEGIIKEGNRIATIVHNLLAFSRQDKETHSPAEIGDIIDASLSLLSAVLRKDQITLDVDIPKNLHRVKCRSQQIQQVLINLLTNARDALNERYAEYNEDKLIRISARAFEKGVAAWIRITVEDHGSGIPENVAKRIFDPFFTTKPREKGTGLGLSVSYGIVKEHHGELSVESVPGEYTRFHIDLRVNNGWKLKDQESEG